LARGAEVTTTAAEPSFMVDALPAVTVPSFLNTGSGCRARRQSCQRGALRPFQTALGLRLSFLPELYRDNLALKSAFAPRLYCFTMGVHGKLVLLFARHAVLLRDVLAVIPM